MAFHKPFFNKPEVCTKESLYFQNTFVNKTKRDSVVDNFYTLTKMCISCACAYCVNRKLNSADLLYRNKPSYHQSLSVLFA